MSTNTKIHSDLAEQLKLRRKRYMAREWLADLAERKEREQQLAEREQQERVHSARVFPLLLAAVVILSGTLALWRSC